MYIANKNILREPKEIRDDDIFTLAKTLFKTLSGRRFVFSTFQMMIMMRLF